MIRTIPIGMCAAVVMAGVLHTEHAAAGARVTSNVTINTTTKTASGALGTARRVGLRQYISCDVYSATSNVHCEATTETGAHIECSIPRFPNGYDERPSFTIGAINPDSFISFIWGTAPGVAGNLCMAVRIVSSSEYEPKL
jgi:hypothetical protein